MNESSLNDILLTRQPVLNLQQNLVGYALSLQTPIDNSSANGYTPSHAAALVCAAYAELGMRSALGDHKAFLGVDLDFLHDDAIEALPPEAVVLELFLDAAPDARTLERCRNLRDRRYSLALSSYSGLDELSRPLLTLLDVIKIDISQHDDSTLSALAGPLSRLPLKLLAKGVTTRERMAHCQKIGFQLFQGLYFACPEIVSGRRLTASQSSLIQLINLASRDADTHKIEEGIKREPALAINLLRIVNSVAFGLSRQTTSLRNAITLLGRRQLQRWLQLFLMTPAGKTVDGHRAPLLQLAALRGRMMEMLSMSLHPHDTLRAEQAFITGIMSMMPAALGLPMSEIFEQLALEDEVMLALESHGGDLGMILALLECYDTEDGEGCNALLARIACPRLNRGTLNTCLADSLRWVNEFND